MCLWRACNLTSFSPCFTGPVDYLFASRHKGPRFKSPGGVLMWNQDSPVSDVSLHWWPRRDWSSLQPRLRRASSQTVTRPSCWQCDNPTWSHTAFLSLSLFFDRKPHVFCHVQSTSEFFFSFPIYIHPTALLFSRILGFFPSISPDCKADWVGGGGGDGVYLKYP